MSEDEQGKIPEPTDVEVLLDADTVAGYTIKPWTIPKVAKQMTPIFEQISVEVKKRKLNFRDFYAIKPDGGIEILNIDQLYFALMPFVPDIIVATLDLKEGEIEKIPQGELFGIMMVIVRQNIGYLKNCFALMAQATRTLASAGS